MVKSEQGLFWAIMKRQHTEVQSGNRIQKTVHEDDKLWLKQMKEGLGEKYNSHAE